MIASSVKILLVLILFIFFDIEDDLISGKHTTSKIYQYTIQVLIPPLCNPTLCNLGGRKSECRDSALEAHRLLPEHTAVYFGGLILRSRND